MNSLIKNELTKIFHKKFIYIIFIILILVLILNYVLDNTVYNENSDENLDTEQSVYEKMQEGLSETSEEYKSYKASIEKVKLKKKYSSDSWQRNYIDLKGEEIISNYIFSEGTAEYDECKNKYDTLIKNLDENNWKELANKDKEEYEKQLEVAKQENDNSTIEIMQNRIKVLNWRLDKNISYADSNMNTYLKDWEAVSQSLISNNSSDDTATDYEKKEQKQILEGQKNLTEYAINNNVLDKIKDDAILNQAALATKADKDLIEVFSSCSIIIIIAIVVVAGTIVSEEFNKGTIKLLLVKPYSRRKILASKFIASFIITILFSLATLLAQFVIGGLFLGFDDYTKNVTIYNFTKSAVENISTLQYIGISFICILPKFILLQTLAFTLSAMFTNSPIAIAIPLLGVMSESIINNLVLTTKKARFLYLFVTPNWDFSIYLFGKYPIFENLTASISVLVCIAYFILMIFLSNFFFKRKEIKNI